MTTMTFMQVAAVAALLTAGCGGEGEIFTPDADAGTGGAGGQTGMAGGQGGTATGIGGVGGLPDPGLNSLGRVTFTRADHDLCMAWPVCPIDVTAPLRGGDYQIRPDTCRFAFDGLRMNCGICSNAAGTFVGRCIAPMVDVNKKPLGGWMLCTGTEYQPSESNKGDPKTNSQLVCEG